MKGGGYIYSEKASAGKRAEMKSARKKHKATRARPRLEKLTFGTFNVRTAAVNCVNGIGHINTLLRPCVAKGCDVIGLQETKRDGTSEISASGYRVFCSGDCSMVKGRKGQRGVGLAIKEEIVKKAGEDRIAIGCISARFLKARIPIKSIFVTFVVAYAPTEKAPEGQKVKYMAALSCTLASMPAREYVFVLTYASARTGKSGEGGGEADSKVLGAYGRDKLNENGKLLLLSFAEDNKLALLNTFFCTPKSGVSYTFQSANRSKGQARLDYILTKQADRRLIHCVNVRRPPLEAPESNHNLVYAKVRIPRRSAPNQRKRDSTKETPKLANLRRLMTDPNLRCQVANAIVAALPPIPDGTYISDIATDMADVMLSTAAELVPRSKRPRGAQGWCAGPGVEAETNAARQQREEARRHLRAKPHNCNLRRP